ncbi:hypothetical protein A2996_02200 [Candidatus Campbellbacteria bacterium RIFCSPLOWO2_01_FULL_34_15]|uniref:Uncharacterized protein n=1 Tax=Candidatus Campbellbacteria bacterium RIFCSPLOWO2_01_FULL_34_15 TaxID=1797579 RepID=A0A1F5ENS3_9BACT|nr:MAG: hypothetical protein A2996_02200 [Candidatus Campbellbacteria bacterium RIFCSPLOWO2_01_FULL_34_15]
MNKGSSGHEVAKYLKENNGKAYIENIADSLGWSADFASAVIRDMQDLRKTVKISSGAVCLTDLGFAELAKVQ